MTMRRNDYDPGSPSDPPPRRRRQLGDEYDDAWAGADPNNPNDDGAAYTWEDPRDGARHDDDPDLNIPPARRRYRRRYPSPDSPSYHRDRAHIGEYGEYYEKPKQIEPRRASSTGRNIPYWQILMLVILGLVAFLVTVLACVSILNL
jgi:hypothetical protein